MRHLERTHRPHGHRRAGGQRLGGHSDLPMSSPLGVVMVMVPWMYHRCTRTPVSRREPRGRAGSRISASTRDAAESVATEPYRIDLITRRSQVQILSPPLTQRLGIAIDSGPLLFSGDAPKRRMGDRWSHWLASDLVGQFHVRIVRSDWAG